jgi:transposase, IS5 family
MSKNLASEQPLREGWGCGCKKLSVEPNGTWLAGSADKTRDVEMRSTRKRNQWHFGMKAHIGVDADSGLVHTVRGTAAHVNDVTEGNSLLHGQETQGFGDAGYQGIDKRPDAKPGVTWHVAMRNGKRTVLDLSDPVDELINRIEKARASIRAQVEHPFRVIKKQFGHVKTRYKGRMKNIQQLHTLFVQSNLWMVRKRILQGAWR